MPACNEPKCVAIAEKGGLCVLHAAGYQQHSGVGELRCDNCRRVILKDEWYQRDAESLHHTKKCTTHPDVVKERATAAEAHP